MDYERGAKGIIKQAQVPDFLLLSRLKDNSTYCLIFVRKATIYVRCFIHNYLYKDFTSMRTRNPSSASVVNISCVASRISCIIE